MGGLPVFAQPRPGADIRLARQVPQIGQRLGNNNRRFNCMDTHSPHPHIDQEIGEALLYLTKILVRILKEFELEFSNKMSIELFVSRNIRDLLRILSLWKNDVTGSFEVNEQYAILGTGAVVDVPIILELQDMRSRRQHFDAIIAHGFQPNSLEGHAVIVFTVCVLGALLSRFLF